MKQTDLGLHLTTKRTRKREFLAQMERVVPWVSLVGPVAPCAPAGKKGHPPLPWGPCCAFISCSSGSLIRIQQRRNGFSTACRGQKTLQVELSYRRTNSPLWLLVDSTGIKFMGASDWKRKKQGAEYRR